MESLNMNNLARTLPSSATVRAEQDLSDKFKAAALSLTTLYRSSQQSGKTHYDAGYDAGYLTALDDLLSVIQHGVSASTDAAVASGGAHEQGMSIGRVMDWIEARSEAIRMKTKDHEDDEDDSEKKAGASQRTPVLDNTPNLNTTQKIANMIPRTSAQKPRKGRPSAAGSSPSPPPATPALQYLLPPAPPAAAIAPPSKHQIRSRPRPNEADSPSTPPAPVLSGNSQPPSVASILGAKRRHAAMVHDAYAPATATVAFPSMDDSNMMALSPTLARGDGITFTIGAGTPAPVPVRRRVRNSRVRDGALALSRVDNLVGAETSDAMDTEDDGGRERKRVARR